MTEDVAVGLKRLATLFGGVEPRRHRAIAAVFAAAFALGACTGDGGETPTPEPSTGTTSTPPKTTTQREPAAGRLEEDGLEPPPCPAELTNCRRASGTILYVERVDPDGDGDAHFVLASGEGITAPGITILDVRTDLRPSPLPGPGEEIAGAGPVYPGSRGQLQIEAVAIRTPP